MVGVVKVDLYSVTVSVHFGDLVRTVVVVVSTVISDVVGTYSVTVAGGVLDMAE